MSNNEWRRAAREIFGAGVAAADPFTGVKAALQARPVPAGTPIIAVGKAASRMAEAALEMVEKPGPLIIVTNPENAREIAGAELFAAAHPVPDKIGLAAGTAVEALLEAAQGEVLALISGGGSALLPAPVAGLSLDDKIAVSELLLGSGAEITEMNLVRQALSRLKGGGMARAAAPAKLRALILSDVVGDDLRAIASGPTAEPLGGPAAARRILEEKGLWGRIPDAVRHYLETAPEPGPVPPADNALIGSNGQSVRAMAAAARAYDMPVHIHAPALTGDVAEAAQRVAMTNDKGIHLFGGETTVVLRGNGRGGRNQELALRVGLHLAEQRRPWLYLQAGSDGRDGPTDAAGGCVDKERMQAMQSAHDLNALLDNNDAYRALESGGALLKTGGTGTNVADLGVLILG
ncbi:MAG: DUF4147 domain-containing protein [Pseudomonadota bacterium]